MTVSELIAELQKHPADLRVLVEAYEGGFTDPKALVVVPVLLTKAEQFWYSGEYDAPGGLHNVNVRVAPFPALVIPRIEAQA